MEKSQPHNTQDIDPLKDKATEGLPKKNRFWFPPKRHLDLNADEWKRQHDEVSISLRRTMITLLGYSFFCMLTLAAPDVSLIAKNAKIEVPFAGTEVSYQAFLMIGPLTMCGLAIYLHILLGHWLSLGKHKDTFGLPYIFNIGNKAANWLANFIFYWLPCLVLAFFSWKALPRPSEAFLLIIQTAIFFTCMVVLRIQRLPDDQHRFKFNVHYLFLWLLGVCLLLGPQIGFYERNLDLFRADLSEKDLRNVYLFKANLAEADLKGANLSGANLSEANLSEALLLGANLSGVNLWRAKLSSLSGVDLSKTDLSGVDLSGVDLSKTDMSGALLREADLKGADLKGANLKGANLSGALLREADMSGANLSGARLSGARLWKTKLSSLSGINLTGVDLSAADLSGANLSGVDLSKVRLLRVGRSGVELSGANLSGANLSGAMLWDIDMSGANLSGADLSGASLSGTDLSGADLSGAILSGVKLPIKPTRANLLSGAKEVTVEQLCKASILYKAKLDPQLETQIKQECPDLLKEPQKNNSDEK